MSHATHAVSSSSAVLAAAYAKGRPVRYWLNTGNEVVGIWQSKSGQTIGVGGVNRRQRVCVFAAMSPEDNFSRGGMVATLEAIKAYRDVEIVKRANESNLA